MGRIFMRRPKKDGQEDGYDAVLWGTVTRPPEVKKVSGKTLVTFSVNYAKGAFMNCQSWHDNPTSQIASALEKKDVVICAGKFQERHYQKQDGSTGTSPEITCDLIFTQEVFTNAAFGALQPAAEGEDSDPFPPAGPEEDPEYDYVPTV